MEHQSMDVEASSMDDRLNKSLKTKKYLVDEALKVRHDTPVVISDDTLLLCGDVVHLLL